MGKQYDKGDLAYDSKLTLVCYLYMHLLPTRT